MDIEKNLDELEDILEDAWSLPMTSGKCVVDENVIREIIEEIRANLPQEFRKAQNLVKERDSIIAGARAEAQTIIDIAREREAKLINKDEITVKANAKAKSIILDAQNKAKEMKKASIEYVTKNIDEVEELCKSCISEVTKVKNNLNSAIK